MAEERRLGARLESDILRAKTWRCTRFPPLAILVIRTHVIGTGALKEHRGSQSRQPEGLTESWRLTADS